MFRIIIAVFTMELMCPCPAGASPAAVIAAGSTGATASVKGPVTFEVSVISGDIEVVAGAKDKVEIEVTGGKQKNVTLKARGNNRIRAQFGGMTSLKEGDVRVKLPPGSDVRLQAISGDITVKGVGGDVRLQSVSGDVKVDGAGNVRIENVSGDITVGKVAGDVEIETVSGNTRIETVPRDASRLEFETTSGDLDWYGKCGSGCRLEIETLSGRASLHLDKKSSFELELEAFSGGLDDDLGVTKTRESSGGPGPAMGVELEARYGKGAGKIDYESHSGRLQLKKK